MPSRQIDDFSQKGNKKIELVARPAWTNQPLSTSASVSGEHRNISEDEKISSETKQYAMAAVILEEWLHELAAIATEQV